MRLSNEQLELESTDIESHLEGKYFKFSRIFDTICENMIFILTTMSALLIVFIFIFIFNQAKEIFAVNGFGFITNKGFDEQIKLAFNAPAEAPHWIFGALGLLVGSLATTIGALVVAIPFGIGTAIVITELAPDWMRKILQSFVRLLASIPSVIYGLVGLAAVIPFLEATVITNELQVKYIKLFQLTGNCMLAGIIVLSIMIVPIIIALSVDAINSVPKKYREAALALGFTQWRTIIKVVLPAAKSGIIAGIILGMGRAIGEALALSMVSGGVGNVPNLQHGFISMLTPVLTLASAIINKSEAMAVPSIESALFACGVILLITCMSLSLFTKYIEYVIRKKDGLVD